MEMHHLSRSSPIERISKANEMKGEGNVLFGNGEIQKAMKKYHFALLQVKDLEKPAPFSDMVEQPSALPDSTIKEIKDIRCNCYNNLSACLLRKKNYEKVRSYTTQVLEHQPENTKALFRRGQAHLMLKDTDKAEEDFLQVKKINPDDRSVDKFLVQVEELRKVQLSKEKDMYRKMFGGGVGAVSSSVETG